MDILIEQIDALIGLAKLPDNFADIILADPPYNIGKDFGDNKDNLSIEDYVKWCGVWLAECERIMKVSATLYIYGFPEVLCHVAVNLKLPYRWLVWRYDNKTTPKATFWIRSYESILCCWKDTKQRIFNVDDVRIPYTQSFLKNAAGKIRKKTLGRFSRGDKQTTYIAHDKGAMPRDVIECAALAGGAGIERWFLCNTCNDVYKNKFINEHIDHNIVKHPTQKPYKLTKKLLLASKPRNGGVVLIPFAGSGSECAVADDLGMKFIGFEINGNYVKLANGYLYNRKL